MTRAGGGFFCGAASLRRVVVGGALIFGAVFFCSAAFERDARADERWYDRFQMGGFVDVYFGYDTNRPLSRDVFLPTEGSSAHKTNQFSLNLAEIELEAHKPIIVKLALNWGTATEVEHVNEPAGDFIGPGVWKYIQQAYLGYIIPVGNGLKVEAGILHGHVGFEDFYTKENWNYTRSWLAENEPYYQTGLKVTYPFTDRTTVQLFYLNGWANIGEDNGWKTFGAGYLWAHPRVSLNLNTLVGPEQPNDHDHWRFVLDGIAAAQLTTRWQVALTFDYGLEQLPVGGIGQWWGVAAYARLQLRPWIAFAGRAEVFHDGLGAQVPNGLTGTEQTLGEGTLTVELRAFDRLIVKVEGRYDHSDQPVFDGHDFAPLTMTPVKERDQGLVVVGAVATF